MGRVRFDIGVRFMLRNELFIIRELLGDHQLLIESLVRGSQIVVNLDELVNAWAQGELLFEIGHTPSQEFELRTQPGEPIESDSQVDGIVQWVETDAISFNLIVINEEDGLPVSHPLLSLTLNLNSQYPVGYCVTFDSSGEKEK